MSLMYIPLLVKIWMAAAIGVTLVGCLLAKTFKPPIENSNLMDYDENSYS